ncbi:Uncharacterised protein [BD1-7 clade bacterium]|uniref:DUF1365 domain-containing protein n=1 Tax=BD1-7 clade bacterium TaxID=2029982 RepID=A0A5S9PMI1_9GAMM|nr:Uncharacterised protein [BD1-7 clade bacterium]CAA0105603.1 Uncharacterised protein [BD1-7 clade bacterium]
MANMTTTQRSLRESATVSISSRQQINSQYENPIIHETCFYEGTVRHRRFWPKTHAFHYQIFMAYIDIDTAEQDFSHRWLFSTRRGAAVRFHRSDYLKPHDISLRQAVESRLKEQLGLDDIGKIMLLTNLRFFGFIINPISCYYCFDSHGHLIALIAEVTNTPWGETQVYALRCDPDAKYQRIQFNKAMHVSPFNPMNLVYDWRNNTPDEKLLLHMNCVEHPNKESMTQSETERGKQRIHTDATLTLTRKAFTVKQARSLWLNYPLMTGSIFCGIYWQALRLFLKKAPLWPHPKRQETVKASGENTATATTSKYRA